MVATAGLSPVGPAAAAAPVAFATAPALRLPTLHAEPDPLAGGRIVDAEGRQVLLRGVNVNALAEYWPYGEDPTTFPLTTADADRMAGIGWNSVRLLLSWSRVEPEPGAYDEAYLDDVAAAVELLASRGIYTIIDLHQDAWGPTLAAPPGQQCAAGATPAFGWDGAPGWATLDGGASRCAIAGIRELSPAVLAAFAAFWEDAPGPGGVGIQTRYVSMLAHLAGRFATSPAVAGYDVMNEPNAFGPDQQAALATFYARSLRSVRAAERRAGGHRHLFLFEPSALWSATGQGAPPDFSRDPDVVYAAHLYTGGFTADQPITADAFQVARDEARGFGGAPVLSGERGTGADRAGAPGGSYFDASRGRSMVCGTIRHPKGAHVMRLRTLAGLLTVASLALVATAGASRSCRTRVVWPSIRTAWTATSNARRTRLRPPAAATSSMATRRTSAPGCEVGRRGGRGQPCRRPPRRPRLRSARTAGQRRRSRSGPLLTTPGGRCRPARPCPPSRS